MPFKPIDLSPLVKALAQLQEATSHTYNEAKAAEVAAAVEGFAKGATELLAKLEKSLAS